MSRNDAMSCARDRNAESEVVAVAVVRGDRDAVGQLFQDLRTFLITVAGRELNRDLRAKCGASDLVQQTFCEAHRDWHAFGGQTLGELRSWLRGILLNNIRDVTRAFAQTKRKASLERPIENDTLHTLIDPELTPGTRACANEEARAVARAIAALPGDYRRVIEPRSKENRSFQEIGRVMDRSPDAARMLWFRAIERLRGELVKPDAT